MFTVDDKQNIATRRGKIQPVVLGFNSMTVESWAMQCCGLGALHGFTGSDKFAADPAEFFSMLHIQSRHAGYHPYNIIYCLSDLQLKSAVHKLLLENGSKELDSFKNEAHGPSNLYLFRFNMKNVIGKYIDKDGNIIKTSPNVGIKENANSTVAQAV